MIIVDTREQLPLWDPEFFEVKEQKLDEGDYTTEELHNVAHAERKSPNDLYGSIIQGHERFRNELIRAQQKGIKLAVFVECPAEMFFRKRFDGAWRLKAPGQTLRKIVGTLTVKYNIEFIWCEDREDMKDKMCLWFAKQTQDLNTKVYTQ